MGLNTRLLQNSYLKGTNVRSCIHAMNNLYTRTSTTRRPRETTNVYSDPLLDSMASALRQKMCQNQEPEFPVPVLTAFSQRSHHASDCRGHCMRQRIRLQSERCTVETSTGGAIIRGSATKSRGHETCANLNTSRTSVSTLVQRSPWPALLLHPFVWPDHGAEHAPPIAFLA